MRSYDWIDYSSGFGKDKQIAFCSVRQTVKHKLNTECRKSDKIKAVTVHAIRSGAIQ